MAKIKYVKDPEMEEAREKQVEKLNELGIEPGCKVRFRRDEHSNWVYGITVLVEDDDSIRVLDKDIKTRSIMLDRIQFRVRRKRKGHKWADYKEMLEDTKCLKLL